MPSTNAQGFRDAARHRNPSAPIDMPMTMVGSAGRFFTMRLTSTWSRMMVPALIEVTCSAPVLHDAADEHLEQDDGAGVDRGDVFGVKREGPWQAHRLEGR